MNILKFTNGIAFDTSGNYRTLQLQGAGRLDGWFVVGHGTLRPCADGAEAIRVRDELLKASYAAQGAILSQLPTPKFPTVHFQLIRGRDGTLLSIANRVMNTLAVHDVPQKDIDTFWAEMGNSDSYAAALITIMRWVCVC